MSLTIVDWAAPGLQDRLGALGHPARVQVVAQTGSTNSDLLALAQGASAGASGRVEVLLAESQTAGRGRHGRTWQAQAGASLTFSLGLVLRPQRGWGALSLVVGHAVAQALQPWPLPETAQGQGRLLLKWPNDLWWFDRMPETPAQRALGQKVGGILIETTALAGPEHPPGARWVVVGIGINVRPLAPIGEGEGDGDDATPSRACTAQWRPQDDAAALWHSVTPAVLQNVRRFEQDGLQPFQADISARELLVGCPVVFSGGAVQGGLCVGIGDDGALLVDDGRALQRVVAGEARVRPDSRFHAPHGP